MYDFPLFHLPICIKIAYQLNENLDDDNILAPTPPLSNRLNFVSCDFLVVEVLIGLLHNFIAMTFRSPVPHAQL